MGQKTALSRPWLWPLRTPMARPTTALIVDDESHVRSYVRLLLKELGIETCWEAANGNDVLLQIAANNPELVLLDLNLPGIGGMQVLEQIAARHPDLPVLIMTAQNSLETVHEAARLGASGYVVKHHPRREVLGALREFLESMDEAPEESAGAA